MMMIKGGGGGGGGGGEADGGDGGNALRSPPPSSASPPMLHPPLLIPTGSSAGLSLLLHASSSLTLRSHASSFAPLSPAFPRMLYLPLAPPARWFISWSLSPFPRSPSKCFIFRPPPLPPPPTAPCAPWTNDDEKPNEQLTKDGRTEDTYSFTTRIPHPIHGG
ncbi:hypothetical protein niasHS_014186 [Heterodera schachtii]|uniref:Uncharacterized protein n=1 Tax=Heterodera schachtii TaxID=97005 RepID=A0ABD2IBB1_HETSC